MLYENVICGIMLLALSLYCLYLHWNDGDKGLRLLPSALMVVGSFVFLVSQIGLVVLTN